MRGASQSAALAALVHQKKNCLPRCKADCAKNCCKGTSKWFKNSTLKMGAVQATCSSVMYLEIWHGRQNWFQKQHQNEGQMDANIGLLGQTCLLLQNAKRRRKRAQPPDVPLTLVDTCEKMCWILTVPRNNRMSFTRAFKSIVYGILCKQTAISSLQDRAAPNEV